MTTLRHIVAGVIITMHVFTVKSGSSRYGADMPDRQVA